MVDEEVRRIQLTGRSTYIISLPKRWVSEMGLKHGGQLVILQEGESLILTPRSLARPRIDIQEAVLKISESDPPEKIARAIITIYLNGYNSIRVRTLSGHITPSQRNIIRELVRKKIVGTEIISDSPKEMLLKVLVSYPELSVESALRRMCLIASSMHEDSIKALANLDRELAKNVIELDDEVDRFSFYIIRQLKAAVQNNRILRDIGLSNPKDCLGYRVIAKFVERVADHAVRIAENILSMYEAIEDETALQKISEMSIFARLVFEDSIKSLFKRDYQLAEETISKAKKIVLMETEAIKVITEKTGKLTPNMRMILESIRRAGEYSSDIAEIVLNLNVNQILMA